MLNLRGLRNRKIFVTSERSSGDAYLNYIYYLLKVMCAVLRVSGEMALTSMEEERILW